MKTTYFEKNKLKRFYNAQILSYNNVEVPCEELFVMNDLHDLGKENFKIHLWMKSTCLWMKINIF